MEFIIKETKQLSYYQYLSQNKYRKYITNKGRAYKEKLQGIFKEEMKDKEMLTGKLSIKFVFEFDNKRANDLDNFIKPILDSMSGILFQDDRQIYHLEASKKDGCEKNNTVIYLCSIPTYQPNS